MPRYSFALNGRTVSVDAPADASLLWVLRDTLGVTGPKYGCGVGVCRACTSHLDGGAFQPCTTRSPTATAGGRGTPRRRICSSPFGSDCTSMGSNSIPQDERSSFVLAQEDQPGRMKSLTVFSVIWGPLPAGH